MKINLISTVEITDLEKETPHQLVVNERSPNMNLPKYYVSFEYGEVKENGMLTTYSGNGNTIDEALKDYCTQISCKTFVFNAYTGNRKEINLSKIVHTKL